jgi:hypothetical protein
MATTAPSMTAADQKARYEEQGYLTFPEMLDRSEVAVLRAALDELLEEAARIPDDGAAQAGINALTTSEKFSFTRSVQRSTARLRDGRPRRRSVHGANARWQHRAAADTDQGPDAARRLTAATGTAG